MTRFLLTLTFLLSLPLAADYEKANLIVSADGREGTMHLYRFSSSRATIQLIPKGKFANLGAAMKSHQCLAGCNGGFFDTSYQPLGEVIAGGKKSGRPNLASSLTSGVIYQLGHQLEIERAKSFYAKKITPQQLLQTGPFLVENGTVVNGLSNRRFARRTIIATNEEGDWLIAYTPPTTLAQLAKSLQESGDKFGFKIQTALNCDGGSSSALWVAKGPENNPFYLKEIKPVANFIGIVPK
jgi:hypothetical protein